MTVLWKQIKPKKLKYGPMRLALLNEMRKVGTGVKQDFEKTTATWRNKPRFEVAISLTAPGPLMSVGTADEVYRYLDQGTRGHWVRPVKAKALRFQSQYTAKTIPGVIGSKGGGPSGPFRFSKGHYVSGITPRRFSKEIEKKWTPRFKRQMEATMVRVTKASGHSL